jgi:hypothetical protein
MASSTYANNDQQPVRGPAEPATMRLRRRRLLEADDSGFPAPVRAGVMFVGLFIALHVIPRSRDLAEWIATVLTPLLGFRLERGTVNIVLVLAALVVLLVWYAVHASARLRASQAVRDRQDIGAQPFALYLRPFESDAAITLQNPHYSHIASIVLSEENRIGPEEFVGRVLEAYIHVIQIGGDPIRAGATRVYAGEHDWRERFFDLSRKASVLIVSPLLFPNRSGGPMKGGETLWELAFLAQSGLLERTLLLMPRVRWWRRRRVRDAWTRAADELALGDLRIPAYRARGGVFAATRDTTGWTFSIDHPVGRLGRRQLALALVEATENLAAKLGFLLKHHVDKRRGDTSGTRRGRLDG